MTNLSYGEAKREVLALMKDIDVYLADGHTKNSIYEMYKAQGKITCKKAAFYRWVDRLSDQHPREVKNKTLPTAEKAVEASPVKIEEPRPTPTAPSEKETGLLVARPKLKRFED
ncbi:MAG: hypothetical protein HWE30_17870 [Methylocystaceae bacterium]|nr:hypothetical protein [Methylocystaceae bacterium]